MGYVASRLSRALQEAGCELRQSTLTANLTCERFDP